MGKFLISEFDACHKFQDKIRKDFLKQGENFSFTQNVSCGNFTIFLGYFKKIFNIVFVEKVTDLAKKSYLCSYGWKVHHPLVNRGKYMKFSEDDPDSEVSITFTMVFKRKKA